MSKSVSAILIKFVLTFGSAWIAFNLMDKNRVEWIFLSAALATALNYIVADTIILPSRSNALTTAVDVVLSFLSAYIVTVFVPGFNPPLVAILAFALIVGVIEYFFHSFLLSTTKVSPKKNS